VDKKSIAIVVLSCCLVGLGIWTFGYRETKIRRVEGLLEDSLQRSANIEESARAIQDRNSKLERELEKERNIIAELQTTSSRFESLYREFESRYREQRKIVERITGGNIEIDATVGRIEQGIERSLEILEDFAE